MKAWQWSVVALACLAAAACRSDPNIPYLERDLRMQEDKIYQLKALREDDEAMLDSCRRENATLRKRLAEVEDSDSRAPRDSRDSQAAPRWSGPAGTIGPEVKPPSVDLGAPSTEVPETFKPKTKSKPIERSIAPDADSEAPPAKIDAVGPRSESGAAAPSAETPADDTAMSGPALLPGMADEQPAATSRAGTVPVFAPAKTGLSPSPQLANPAKTGLSTSTSPSHKSVDNKQVQKIVLNRMLTGGYNTSGRSGHDGVMVVIEPRNAKGEVLSVPGELSVVVIDPALSGAESRVARWDFTADEVAARFRKTVVANGIQLEMPWPAEPPQNEDLHVFVRYTTADGRKLEADKPIKLKPPIEVVERNAAAAGDWTRKPRTGGAAAAASEPAAPAPEARADTWRAASAPTVRVPTSPVARTASRTSRGTETTVARPVWSPTRQ